MISDWREVTVDDLKSQDENALATGPFGSSIGAQFFQNNGVPVIRGSNLSNDDTIRFIDDGFVFISEAKAKEFKRSTVRKDDLIFTCWGTINQVGLIGENTKYSEYVISNKQMKFTPNQSKAESLFLYYLFSGPDLQKKIKNESIGSSVPGFNLGQLRAIKFRIPCISEQRAIAAALSDVDALLASQEALIAKKRLIQQGAMQELLTGRRRLPGFGGEWEVKKIGEIVILHYGRSQQGISAPGGEFLIYGTGGIVGRTSQYIYDRPSVIIGRKGTINFPQYVDKPFWAIDTTYYVEVSHLVDPKFLYYLFTTIDWYSYNEASGVPSLSAPTIGRIEVKLPEEPEQRAIAEVLSDMDSEILALEQQRDKTRLVKQGMMQELLTGRRRLNQD